MDWEPGKKKSRPHVGFVCQMLYVGRVGKLSRNLNTKKVQFVSPRNNSERVHKEFGIGNSTGQSSLMKNNHLSFVVIYFDVILVEVAFHTVHGNLKLVS